MGNFRRDNRSGGRRDYGQGDFQRHSFGGRRGMDRQMHKATCSNCGKDCEVPFKPTGSKPVFCSECFEKKGGGASSRRFRDRSPRRTETRPQNDEQLEAINRKLDKILVMLTTTPSVITVAAKKKTKTPKKETPKTKNN